jgi:diguanylate cyclase (GGDEF)-like protein
MKPDFLGEIKPVPALSNLERLSKEELMGMALQDELTGLLNRRGFNLALDYLVNTMPGKFSLVFMDIDGMKHANDTYGHDAGDVMLKKAAEIIQGDVRTHPHIDSNERRRDPELTDIVTAARLGGDEFAIFITGVSDQEILDKIQSRIQQDLADHKIKASLDGRPHNAEETAINLKASADLKMIAQKEARKEKKFKELSWFKRRASKLGDRLIKFAGMNPPRI